MDQQNPNNSLAQREETGLARMRNYILSPVVVERFQSMMGNGAVYYLNQVLTAVSGNTELQKCTPQSVLTAAMTAASLRLSIGPSTGQAWIVPYNGTAQFQIGYRGVYELAQRTGLYRFINVIDVYEGETVTEDRMTGMHNITGRKTGPAYIGFMLYFELVDGFKKSFYMTTDEILDHAKHYSKSFKNPRSLWHDEREKWKMYRKTVLVNGLKKWGRFRSEEAQIMDAVDTDDYVDGVASTLPDEAEATASQPPRRSEAENMAALGFEPDPPREERPAPRTYTREDAARDKQPAPLPTRKDLTAQYFKLAEKAQVLGIAVEKLQPRWSDQDIQAKNAALEAAITARENAIPG